MMGLNRPITLGRIDYANAWPIFHGMEQHSGTLSFEAIPRVPAELNRLLSIGELDVAAISSFSYGQFADQYVLLPQLSVGSIGKVHSILLFSKEPIDRRRPERIAVTSASATSVNLLKIIMAMYFEHSPQYISAEPRLDLMLETADAALLIGDPAIQASWGREGLHVIDLGELWNQWTGLGMTYAVVAARRQAVELAPEAIRSIYEALLANKRYNLMNIDPLIADACRQIGGDYVYWEAYFRSLQYDFGSKLQEGLALYFQYAKQMGLLNCEVKLNFFEDQFAQKVKE